MNIDNVLTVIEKRAPERFDLVVALANTIENSEYFNGAVSSKQLNVILALVDFSAEERKSLFLEAKKNSEQTKKMTDDILKKLTKEE